jgi:hypothetical protein
MMVNGTDGYIDIGGYTNNVTIASDKEIAVYGLNYQWDFALSSMSLDGSNYDVSSSSVGGALMDPNSDAM